MFFNKKVETAEIILDMQNIPSHIAIIMDGNGRWASKRNLPRKMGHHAGAETLEKTIEDCRELGVKHLTVYAFSTENWKRSQEEIAGLMDILRQYLEKYFERFSKDNIKMDIIGDISRFDLDIQESIMNIQEKSKEKTGMTVHIALNYGGRDELCRSMQKVAKQVLEGRIAPEDIDEDIINSYLDTSGIPDPELLIRTSGEERISNFLLWQIAYAEIYFTEELWPDFSRKSLEKAIYMYQNRERRFGGRIK